MLLKQQEWIRLKRCTLSDCEAMALWTPDPFVHFKCTIGDLALRRDVLPPSCLARCGLTVRVLREKYGLQPDLMCMLKYTPRFVPIFSMLNIIV